MDDIFEKERKRTVKRQRQQVQDLINALLVFRSLTVDSDISLPDRFYGHIEDIINWLERNKP